MELPVAEVAKKNLIGTVDAIAYSAAGVHSAALVANAAEKGHVMVRDGQFFAGRDSTRCHDAGALDAAVEATTVGARIHKGRQTWSNRMVLPLDPYHIVESAVAKRLGRSGASRPQGKGGHPDAGRDSLPGRHDAPPLGFHFLDMDMGCM